MPNIRRAVVRGDHVFVVSGKVPAIPQYVVGGFKVEEKITALRAHARFPEHRLRLDDLGILQGNIAVDADGHKHPLDHHSPHNFDKRIENYLVGSEPISLQTPQEVAIGREQTLEALSMILRRPTANRVIDVMSRWAKLDEAQVNAMLDWLRGIKTAAT